MSKFLFIKELGKSNLPDDLVLTTEYRQVQLILSETVVDTTSSTQPALLNTCRYPATKANLLLPWAPQQEHFAPGIDYPIT